MGAVADDGRPGGCPRRAAAKGGFKAGAGAREAGPNDTLVAHEPRPPSHSRARGRKARVRNARAIVVCGDLVAAHRRKSGGGARGAGATGGTATAGARRGNGATAGTDVARGGRPGTPGSGTGSAVSVNGPAMASLAGSSDTVTPPMPVRSLALAGATGGGAARARSGCAVFAGAFRPTINGRRSGRATRVAGRPACP